jgi:peptide/nickel transport system permease protein
MTAEATPSMVAGTAAAGPDDTGSAGAGRAPRSRSTAAYLRYAAGKLAGAVVSLLAVLVTSFFLFRLIPGDPVKFMTGGRPVSA